MLPPGEEAKTLDAVGRLWRGLHVERSGTIVALGGGWWNRADVAPPRLPIETGASLRVIRPARFVEPDEVIFRQNAERFAERGAGNRAIR